MELLCIVALLASNLWLISRHLKKADNNRQPPTENPTSPTQLETPPDPANESIVGESKLDDDFINSVIDARVKKEVDRQVEAKVKEEVERVFSEMTHREDVEIEHDDNSAQVPNDKLDETFTHQTISEAEGKEPEAAEPTDSGDDFKAIESAVRCAKDEPHTPEEAQAAKVTLAGLQGTQIEDHICLDSKVKMRLLTIIYGDEDETLTPESIKNKKTVFSGTVDTRDVDEIKLNILT